MRRSFSNAATRLFVALLRRTRPDLADRAGAGRTVLDLTDRGVLHCSLVAASRLAHQRDPAIVGCVVALLIGLWCGRSLAQRVRWLGSVLVGTGLGLVIARFVVVPALSGPVRLADGPYASRRRLPRSDGACLRRLDRRGL